MITVSGLTKHYGDRIAVFHQVVVEQLGAPMDLYNRPANEFVAGMYLYSLVCDGKIVDTKQMLLTE